MSPSAVAASNLPAFIIPCPQCGGRMVVRLVAPAMFADDIDDITHRCEGCGAELTRSVKRARRHVAHAHAGEAFTASGH